MKRVHPLRSARGRLLLGIILALVVSSRFYLPLVLTGATDPVKTLALPLTNPLQQATPTSTPTPTPVENPLNALHVEGNQLVTVDGRRIILRGVNRDGSDFFCAEGKGIFDGPTGPKSIAALLSWHINAVRIPLNEGCWRGAAGIQPAYSGAAYQAAIAAYVAALTAHGIYAILDLHKVAPGIEVNTHQFLPMPDADHAPEFWRQVALLYGNNGMVLFDLYNEPHDISWTCWRDGESACHGLSYRAVGMRDLVQTVRATGATNVLLLTAAHWGNDVGQWLSYAPIDPLHSLAASWHIYTQTIPCADIACFDRVAATVAEHVPLVAAEFGVDVSGTYCGVGGVDLLLDWLDQHGVSYTAWTWNVGEQTCGSLSLISNWGGTPKAPNGTLYRTHLLAVSP